ncbi:MAG: hypothetical protein FWE23_03645 [Chitinivibrionia bacterium]|nr:hypothetical protein [Chitinivibrionia bacterium]
MKKITKISLVILGLFGFASAQITLLHTFDGSYLHSGTQARFFSGYFPQVPSNNQVRFYNEDFSLRAQVNIPIPDGYAISSIANVSENVFSTDGRLEFTVSFLRSSSMRVQLFNENGNMLRDFGDGSLFAFLHLTSDGNYRLFVNRRGTVGTETRTFTDIYSLPGREPSVSSTPARAVRSSNPARFAGINNGQIQLNLTAGRYTAQLLNPQGRLINSVDINAINGVNATGLRTDNLARGVFILNVEQAGITVLNQRIMID